MSLNNSKYKSEIILIFVTILWGATFVIVKEALQEISPMLFIAVRFIITALFLLPFVWKQKFDLKSVYPGILLGILLFAGFATQTVGLKFTSATKSGFLTGTSVIMIPLLQILIEKRPPTKGVVLGTLIVMLGITFLSSGGNSVSTLLQDFGSNFNFGDGLTLICAFFFALYIIYLDVETKKHNFWILLFVQIITTMVLAILFAVIFSTTGLEEIKYSYSTKLILAILYTAIFATLITTALMTKYQKNITPTKAGIIYSFEPLFAALFAFFLLGEKITNFGYFGAGLILLGLLVSELYESMFRKNE
ncbi:MAG: DMT family transporter [Melioribacteraceae bacterium]